MEGPSKSITFGAVFTQTSNNEHLLLWKVVSHVTLYEGQLINTFVRFTIPQLMHPGKTNLREPYIGPFFLLVERKIKIIAKTYCKDLDIWLAFTSYKWSNMFSVKESIPIAFSSQVVYNLHVQDVIRVMSVKTLYILVSGFVSTYSRIAIPISLNIFRVLIDSDSS